MIRARSHGALTISSVDEEIFVQFSNTLILYKQYLAYAAITQTHKVSGKNNSSACPPPACPFFADFLWTGKESQSSVGPRPAGPVLFFLLF
jgi:hypothetical protein